MKRMSLSILCVAALAGCASERKPSHKMTDDKLTNDKPKKPSGHELIRQQVSWSFYLLPAFFR